MTLNEAKELIKELRAELTRKDGMIRYFADEYKKSQQEILLNYEKAWERYLNGQIQLLKSKVKILERKTAK